MNTPQQPVSAGWSVAAIMVAALLSSFAYPEYSAQILPSTLIVLVVFGLVAALAAKIGELEPPSSRRTFFQVLSVGISALAVASILWLFGVDLWLPIVLSLAVLGGVLYFLRLTDFRKLMALSNERDQEAVKAQTEALRAMQAGSKRVGAEATAMATTYPAMAESQVLAYEVAGKRGIPPGPPVGSVFEQVIVTEAASRVTWETKVHDLMLEFAKLAQEINEQIRFIQAAELGDVTAVHKFQTEFFDIVDQLKAINPLQETPETLKLKHEMILTNLDLIRKAFHNKYGYKASGSEAAKASDLPGVFRTS